MEGGGGYKRGAGKHELLASLGPSQVKFLPPTPHTSTTWFSLCIMPTPLHDSHSCDPLRVLPNHRAIQPEASRLTTQPPRSLSSMRSRWPRTMSYLLVRRNGRIPLIRRSHRPTAILIPLCPVTGQQPRRLRRLPSITSLLCLPPTSNRQLACIQFRHRRLFEINLLCSLPFRLV